MPSSYPKCVTSFCDAVQAWIDASRNLIGFDNEVPESVLKTIGTSSDIINAHLRCAFSPECTISNLTFSQASHGPFPGKRVTSPRASGGDQSEDLEILPTKAGDHRHVLPLRESQGLTS